MLVNASHLFWVIYKYFTQGRYFTHLIKLWLPRSTRELKSLIEKATSDQKLKDGQREVCGFTTKNAINTHKKPHQPINHRLRSIFKTQKSLDEKPIARYETDKNYRRSSSRLAARYRCHRLACGHVETLVIRSRFFICHLCQLVQKSTLSKSAHHFQ